MDNKTLSFTSEQLFNTLDNHLVTDSSPSEYLSGIVNDPGFKEYPFQFLYQLQFVEQSPIYHPEGNVWNHTLLVVDEAAKRRSKSVDPFVFMWAALLHDIGKPATTKVRHGKITSYNHEKIGAQLAFEFLSLFKDDQAFIENVCTLIQFHMQPLFVVKNLPYANIREMERKSNIHEIALLGLCDRLGRTGASQSEEEKNIDIFIKKCNEFERR